MLAQCSGAVNSLMIKPAWFHWVWRAALQVSPQRRTDGPMLTPMPGSLRRRRHSSCCNATYVQAARLRAFQQHVYVSDESDQGSLCLPACLPPICLLRVSPTSTRGAGTVHHPAAACPPFPHDVIRSCWRLMAVLGVRDTSKSDRGRAWQLSLKLDLFQDACHGGSTGSAAPTSRRLAPLG